MTALEPAPGTRALRTLAHLADGERLTDIAKRERVTADAVYRRLRRACRDAGVRSTHALLAVAVDRQWIACTFEGWIVPDPDAPKRGCDAG